MEDSNEKVEKLNKFCGFCCKTFVKTSCEDDSLPKTKDDKAISDAKYIQHFLTLIGRYLDYSCSPFIKIFSDKEGFTRVKDTGDHEHPDSLTTLATCQVCVALVQSFCDLYHETKCAELQLQWRAKTLVEIMKEARKVSSRMKALKKILSNGNGDGSVDDENYRMFMHLSDNFIQKCSQRLSDLPPRIFLSRVGNTSKSKDCTSPHPQQLSNKEDAENNEGNILQSWIMSFSAVVFLVSIGSPASANTTSLMVLDYDNCDDYVEMSTIETTDKCEPVSSHRENYSNSDDNDKEETAMTCQDDVEINQFLVESPAATGHINLCEELVSGNPELIKKEMSCDDSLSDSSDDTSLSSYGTEGDDLPWQPDIDDKNDDSYRDVNSCELSVCKREVELPQNQMKSKSFCTIEQLFASVNSGRGKDAMTEDNFQMSELKDSEHVQQCKHSMYPVEGPPKKGLNRKNSRRYYCNFCCRDYASYFVYLSHRKSFTHKINRNRFKKETRPDIISTGATLEYANNTGWNESKGSRYDLRKKLKPLTDAQQKEDNWRQELSRNSDEKFSSEISASSDEEVELTRRPTTPEKQLQCRIDGCKIHVGSSKMYASHKKLHEPGVYPCDFCGVIEMNALKLAVHESENHSKRVRIAGRRRYLCPRCPYQAIRLSSYLQHFALVHLDLNIKPEIGFCRTCNMKVKSEQAHFRKHHDTNRVTSSQLLTCPEKDCRVQCITTQGIILHRTGYHKVPGLLSSSVRHLFPCSWHDCTQSFRREETLEKHEKLHGSFKCQFCDMVKDYAPHLSFHEAEHSAPLAENQNVFSCSRCTYSSKSSGLFVTHHLENHLGVTDRILSCTICGNKVKDNALHFRTHHQKVGLDPRLLNNCSECPAYFLKPIQLKKHIRKFHRSETTPVAIKKTYEHRCSFGKCRRPFSSQAALENHLKRHGSFKCKFCNVEKSFAPQIAVHEMKHANPKIRKGTRKALFKCPRCSYRVGTQVNYINHFLNKHLGCKTEIRSFNCGVCGESFSISAALSRHMKECHGAGESSNTNVQKCKQCPGFFLQKRQLLKHEWKMHGGPDYRLICVECGKSFRTNCMLLYHRQVIHGQNSIGSISYERRLLLQTLNNDRTPRCSEDSLTFARRKIPCVKCSETFRMEAELERHQKLHGDFKCQFCQVSYSYAPELAVHEATEHTEPGPKKKCFKCARCLYSSNSETMVVRHHITKHLGLNDLIYQCPICNECFYTLTFMYDHRKYQHNVRGIDPNKIERCDQCSAYFSKKTFLLRHKQKMHDARMDYQSLKCNLCDKTYRTKRTFRHHQKVVHGMGCTNDAFQFACDVNNCKDRFETRDDLEWHKAFSIKHKMKIKVKVVDDGVNAKVVCELCGKECKGNHALRCHMKVHKNRPSEFKCDQCYKSFKFKIALQNHVEYHKSPEEWQHMCAVCSRKCVSKHRLEAHMRTHTKEKPFVCQVCGEKYAHRHNLRHHVNSKHKDEGVQDIPKKVNKRFYVSRKGKKLGSPNVAFSFTSSTGTSTHKK